MIRLYILFASIYLLEGITEVPFVLNVYLRNILAFEPSQIGRILFLGGLWFVVLKPLIGFLADFWGGLNRRWVMVFGLVCSAVGWWLIARAGTPLAMTVGVSLKVLAIASLDVLIDGMIVTVSTERNRSFIQSLVYGCRFGGAMLFSTWAGGRIGDEAAAFVQIFYLFSVLSIVALLPVLIYSRRQLEQRERIEAEDPGTGGGGPDSRTLRQKLSSLAGPSFGWLLALMFLFSLGADTSTYFEPVIEERFGGEFLGGIYTWYYVGILAGLLSFPLVKLRVSMKALFVVSLLGWSLVEISCLALAPWNGALIYGAGGFFNAFSSIALLTVAVAMCKIRGVETFAFAFAVSVKNLMDQSNVLVGGYVMEAVGLTWLFVISSLAGLLPLLVMGKVDFRRM